MTEAKETKKKTSLVHPDFVRVRSLAGDIIEMDEGNIIQIADLYTPRLRSSEMCLPSKEDLRKSLFDHKEEDKNQIQVF